MIRTQQLDSDNGLCGPQDGTLPPGEVMVVEDTPASLRLLSELLESAGYAVRQAPDGELALWSAQTRAPELVLLDVNMPGIDGIEVCRRLKADPVLCAVPVILLSAQHDMEHKVQGFQAGAVDFIGKPYHAEEVLARTRAHMHLSRTQKELASANHQLKQALAELNSARAEMARTERMAALGALVAGIAHELNTPIGNSVLIASTLEDRARAFNRKVEEGVRRSELVEFCGETGQAAELLLRNLRKSADLIDGFKQVAVDQASERRAQFTLRARTEETLMALKPALTAAGIRLVLELPDGLHLDSYPRALTQILMQLTRNAELHAFGGKGGSITVRAMPDGGHVLLDFSDNGCGIPADDLARVFDPFFTTRMGTGMGGLGLHIVHSLVTNVLGGAITVDSAPGQTRFRMRLPVKAPDLLAF
ncbi:sensor histidine kinase [Pseudoduganella sp. RAF53_2]|uniref:sensor histidine kinase n=1 Tax=unclassified Pseudoduganella TaxID=2637179 RepID=UPI003F9E132E